MNLSFYNSITNQTEEFKPIQSGEVKIYSCGPTVYDFPHIGNYRSFLFSDLLHRVFLALGYRVDLVMNLTDIDDKTIRGSIEQGVSLDDYTSPYITAFQDDLKSLNILPAHHYPRATDHLEEMIEMIRVLLDRGYAYQSEGSVYFKLSSFADYGKLSNLKLEEQRAGAGNRVTRVLKDEYEKDEISDFVLWKAYQEEDGGVAYDSPWGRGRPGWHIECSAMSQKYLGTHFDLHTGGIDNKFPHHENEIAQSVCSSGDHFVNYWLHVSHLLVESQKMSKSLGNFYTLRDLLDKAISPLVIRYMLLSSHYRHQFNFTLENCTAAGKAIERVNWFARNLARRAGQIAETDLSGKENPSSDTDLVTDLSRKIDGYKKNFLNCLKDDLNVSGALGALFESITAINPTLDNLHPAEVRAAYALLELAQQVFAVFQLPEKDSGVGEDNNEEDKSGIPAEVRELVGELVKKRETARKNQDFALSDQLRDEIAEHGYQVLDRADGSEILPLNLHR